MRKESWLRIVLGLTVLLLVQRADAAICYVGQGASASDVFNVPDRGSMAHPFATGSAAIAWKSVVTQLRICDDVRFLPGVYHQNVKVVDRDGVSNGPLRISATPGTTTIDGVLTTTDLDFYRQTVFLVLDSSYVTIEGFAIRNDASEFCSPTQNPYPGAAVTSTSYCNAAGIYIANRVVVGVGYGEGSGPHHITIQDNDISNVRSATLLTALNASGLQEKCAVFQPLGTATCLNRFDALPIAIVGYRNGLTPAGVADPSETISDVVIRRNHIRDSSVSSDRNNVGAINLLSNVADVLVEENQVSNLAPRDPVLFPNASAEMTGMQISGERFRSARTTIENTVARPRRLVIRRNQFLATSGSGIYATAANNILIERNSFDLTRRGVQIVTEHSDATNIDLAGVTKAQQVWIRNNLFLTSEVASLDLGMQNGYSPIRDMYVTGNTFYSRPESAGGLFDRPVIMLHRGINGESKFVSNLVLLDYSLGLPACLGGALSCDLLMYREVDAFYSIDVEFAANLWHVAQYTVASWYKQPLFFANPVFQTFAQYRAALEPGAIGLDPGLSAAYTVGSSSPVVDAGIRVTPSWVDSTLDNFGSYGSSSIPELDFFGDKRGTDATREIGMQEL